MAAQIRRQSIFDIWVENSKHKRMNAIIAHILQKLGNSSLPNNILNYLKTTVRSFCQKLEERWAKSGGHRECFLSSNSSWLRGNLNLPDTVSQALQSISQCLLNNRPDRPQKFFEECCSKTKKRKVKSLVKRIIKPRRTVFGH